MCRLLADRDAYTSACLAFVDEFPHVQDISQIDPRALRGSFLDPIRLFGKLYA